MLTSAARESTLYRFSPQFLLGSMAALLLVVVAFRDGVAPMVDTWLVNEEYSHGILIPLISLFLIWQRKETLRRNIGAGSWMGIVIVVVAGAIGLIGRAAAVFVLQQYSMLLVIVGLVVSYGGWKLLRQMAAPLAILFLMVPLPSFLTSNLTAQLQLVSSQIGVAVVRLFGISVFLEGNVIDLGSYKLQVAEACSGLRYLFPLMTLGFIMAYFFKTTMWKRVVVFVSSVPITILMNSIRIGLIGVTVEYFGPGAAEGLLHDFEGWVVFMASSGVLLLEMMLLSRIGGERRSWREQFGLEFPSDLPSGVATTRLPMPNSFLPTLAAVGIMAVLASIPKNEEVTPARTSFISFPQTLESWTGRRDRLDEVYVDALKFDDYLLADYQSGAHSLASLPVNFYVAWYDSQRAGQSAHSPRTCLPGGGWRIADLQNHRVAGVELSGAPLTVNRALIVNGQQQQLVYYWFQQRGRVVTNEYMVKWYLFWDSLTRNRTDGALVRLIAPVPPGSSIEAAEQSLTGFLAASAHELPRFIPN